MFETIVAISTAVNDNAIAIIRLSGDQAIEIVDGIYSKDLSQQDGFTMSHGYIQDGEEIIDEVLVSVFRAPNSYTREDIVEINTHGGAYVTRKIFNLLLTKGARMAGPGEFTKRAYLNGRINLSQAESINDLINANNEAKAVSSIKGVNGSISRLIEPLLEELMQVIGTIEVNIDYPEYDDVVIMTNEKVLPLLKDFLIKANDIVDKARRFRVIKDGIKVAIVGKPNVGKSSLLNALVQKDKAIVTDIPGTTRDLIEDTINLKNISLHLIDTAGIRESDDIIEAEGINRSLKAIEEADLILFVIDHTYNEEDEKLFEYIKDRNYLIVRNKKDLDDSGSQIKIAAREKDISELTDYLEQQYADDYSLINEDVLNNERQISLMFMAANEIKEAIEAVNEGREIDLISDDLYSAYHYLKEILGEESRDDLIDSLFRNFCLGK